MSFPVVPLDSIPSHGLSVGVGDWALPAATEGLGGPARRVGGQLAVTRSGRHITVQGTVEGGATLVCDRCGEPLPLDVSADVDCVYLPVDEIAAKPVDEDEPDEAPDQGEYDGVALDLAHVVRESLALERPARLLCEDLDPSADAACRARFRARAHLGEPEPDPRLAALKNLKPTR